MATGVFGLRKVYIRQNENIDNRNFASWPESAVYGYFAGGGRGSEDSSTIDRIDFFNEVVSLPGKNLPAALDGVGAVYNVSYGYFGGGDNPTPTVVNTITRLDLSTESISVPGKNLPGSRSSTGCVSSSSYGYFGGGFDGSVRVNSILRLDFSSETLSSLTNNLTQLKNTLCGVSNLSYGYFCGGLNPPPASFGRSSVVDRLDFTTETTSAPTTLRLSSGRSNIMPSFNSYYGYISGGLTPPSVNPSRSSTIDRLDFTTEFTTQLTTTLPQTRSAGSGSSSVSYGYYAGGILGLPPTIIRATSIDRLDFSTETSTSTGSNLTQARAGIAHFSYGQSIFRGSKTYGYFAGGFVPATTYINTVTRLDFSTENVSNSPSNNQLLVSSGALAAVSSNSYGYFGGGYNNTPPASSLCNITRLDFSNETTNAPGKNLPFRGWGLATVSNNSYGYFGGGFDQIPNSNICTIARLDFSNETTSAPGKNLPSVRSNLAGTSSAFYGFFGGGATTPSFPASQIDTIVRLDFSNETISLPTKNLPSVRAFFGTVSNNFYGYFAGGGPISGTISTITRLDFSNETASDSPTRNFPVGTTEVFGGTSSAFYGYFGGGATGPVYTSVNTITRLDFSNETVSLPTKNLLSARSQSAAVSNSN